VRAIAITVGTMIACAATPISATAKTDRSTSKCEQRCHEYYCSGGVNPMYCHYACHKKCLSDDHHEK
jgi:hypothetical protein